MKERRNVSTQTRMSTLLAALRRAHDGYKKAESTEAFVAWEDAAMKMWEMVVRAVRHEKKAVRFSGGEIGHQVRIVDNAFVIGRFNVDWLRFVDAKGVRQGLRMSAAKTVKLTR